jgi:2-acylglycerol O-acyltransferase 2
VFHTPFLRYLTLFECIPVDRHSITRAIRAGSCVGLVPDGVAGIFKMHAAPRGEFVALKRKKGLARLALRTGTAVLPAYSFGNTQVLSCWYDRLGLLEALSRKVQASLFVYWGRWGLPIPRRAQITMVVGRLIEVEQCDAPTEQQIDELHERILDEMRVHFDRHKAALGWGDRELKFV